MFCSNFPNKMWIPKSRFKCCFIICKKYVVRFIGRFRDSWPSAINQCFITQWMGFYSQWNIHKCYVMTKMKWKSTKLFVEKCAPTQPPRNFSFSLSLFLSFFPSLSLSIRLSLSTSLSLSIPLSRSHSFSLSLPRSPILTELSFVVEICIYNFLCDIVRRKWNIYRKTTTHTNQWAWVSFVHEWITLMVYEPHKKKSHVERLAIERMTAGRPETDEKPKGREWNVTTKISKLWSMKKTLLKRAMSLGRMEQNGCQIDHLIIVFGFLMSNTRNISQKWTIKFKL